MKTLSDYPLALGEALRRAEAKALRRRNRSRLRQVLLRALCVPLWLKRERTNVVHFSDTEIVISPRR